MKRLCIILMISFVAVACARPREQTEQEVSASASVSASSTPTTRASSAASARKRPAAKPERAQGPPIRVGITGSYLTNTIPESVATIIRAYGGEPVRLYGKRRDTLANQNIQALVLTGGLDIDPSAYGEKDVDGRTKPMIPGRQRHDFALYREAKESSIPVLGYGLGAQEIWVLEGGKLYQDMVTDNQPDHQGVQHKLVIEKPLQEFLDGQDSLIVKCNHHQGFKGPTPPTLEVVAWTANQRNGDERVTEAIMTKRGGWFSVGVQFLLGETQYSEQLLIALIEAAKRKQRK